MIGRSGERWSRISVLAARHDDDDDDDVFVYELLVPLLLISPNYTTHSSQVVDIKKNILAKKNKHLFFFNCIKVNFIIKIFVTQIR